MWSLLSRQAQVSVIVFVTLLAAASVGPALSAATGQTMSLIKLASPIALFIGVVLTTVAGLIWRWLWRSVPALGRLVFPDLNGRWDGTLVSNWIDPATNKGVAPIPTTIRIYQTLLGVTVRMKTGESTSLSSRAFLVPFREAGLFRVWYSYDNSPRAQVRSRSRPHEGVAYLDFELSAAGELKGRYYTDRGTMGDIILTRSSDDPNA